MSALSAGVAGVVLAAGRSQRMGSPKALLPVGGATFIERTVGLLRAGGCAPVYAVCAPGAEDVARLAAAAGALVLHNPAADAQPIDSLRIALREVGDAPAVCVLPVDHPHVTAATVAALLRAHAETSPPVVRPVFQSTPGHPTVFARAVFAELLEAPLPHGARTVIERHASQVRDVPVEDAGVVANIDTPQDLARWSARLA